MHYFNLFFFFLFFFAETNTSNDVCEQDDKMCQVLKSIQNLENKFSSDVGKLSADVGKLSADFGKLSADFGKLSSDVENKINKLSADFGKLSADVASDVGKLSGDVGKLSRYIIPNFTGMAECVINEVSNIPLYPCRINLLKIDQKFYLVTAFHCFYEQVPNMNAYVTQDKIPKELIPHLDKAYINIEKDQILIEIHKDFFVQNTLFKPFEIDSTDYDCQATTVNKVSCCCAFGCSQQFFADVTMVQAHFAEIGHTFYKGESGCLCKDSLFGINKNSCLFLNSHRTIVFQPPSQEEWDKYMACLKYGDIGLLVGNLPKCSDLYKQYHDSLRLSYEYQRSKLSILDLKNYFHSCLSVDPTTLVLQSGENVIAYVIPNTHHLNIKQAGIYELSLQINNKKLIV